LLSPISAIFLWNINSFITLGTPLVTKTIVAKSSDAQDLWTSDFIHIFSTVSRSLYLQISNASQVRQCAIKALHQVTCTIILQVPNLLFKRLLPHASPNDPLDHY